MHDYDDEVGTIERGGKKYRYAFGCHNKERAESEVREMKRQLGVPAIIVPCRSYQVFRLQGVQRK